MADLRANLDHLEALLAAREVDEEALRSDRSLHNDVLFSLLMICQAVIDVAGDIAGRHGLRFHDYTEAVRALAQVDEFSPNLVSALEFGADGVLFAGDSRGGTVYALQVGSAQASDGEFATVRDLDSKIAALLGISPRDIFIKDMAVDQAPTGTDGGGDVGGQMLAVTIEVLCEASIRGVHLRQCRVHEGTAGVESAVDVLAVLFSGGHGGVRVGCVAGGLPRRQFFDDGGALGLDGAPIVRALAGRGGSVMGLATPPRVQMQGATGLCQAAMRSADVHNESPFPRVPSLLAVGSHPPHFHLGLLTTGMPVPEPLSALPADVLATLRGVVFDIDDTVTRGGCLEAEAYAAIHQLGAAGLRLIAVTGRPLGWADVLVRMWPVDLVVGENGAGWVWLHADRRQEGYACDAQERRQQAGMLRQIRAKVEAEMEGVREAGDQPARRCDLAFDIGESVSLPAHEVERLVLLIEGEGAATMVSSVHCHAVPGPWDKATGARAAAAEALEIDLREQRHQWLFIGDSRNDAAASAWFPISVGVANVERYLPALPVAPRYITEQDRGRGFVQMANAVLEARR